MLTSGLSNSMYEFAAWGKLSVSIVKYDGDKVA